MRRGFTLIELLIVVAVIGVLAGGVMIVINPAAQFQKANDARRKSDLAQIQKAIETYYQDNRIYPESTVDYKIKTIDTDNPIKNWGDSWLPYMGTLPKDPSSAKDYVYLSNGQSYYLYASLDRGDGIQACESTDGLKCDNAPAQCGTKDCNYGVSSPNVSP